MRSQRRHTEHSRENVCEERKEKGRGSEREKWKEGNVRVWSKIKTIEKNAKKIDKDVKQKGID